MQLTKETIKQVRVANDFRLKMLDKYLDATDDQRRILREFNSSVQEWFDRHEDETVGIMNKILDDIHPVEAVRIDIETDYVWRIVIRGIIVDDWTTDNVCIIPIDDFPGLIEAGWKAEDLEKYCVEDYGKAPGGHNENER